MNVILVRIDRDGDADLASANDVRLINGMLAQEENLLQCIASYPVQ